MSHDGNGLERFREWLPRDGEDPVPARSLSVALGWDPAKWRSLEKKEK